MGLPTELEAVLDRARQEARRFGHAATRPLHVALALAKAEPVRFERAFGSSARARVEQSVLRLTPRLGAAGDGPETTALFARAARAPAARRLGALLAALHPTVDALPPVGGAPRPGRAAHAPPEHSPRRTHRPDRASVVPRALAGLVEAVTPDPPVLDRSALVRELVSALGRREPRNPLVVGAPGAGRTAILRALARFLANPAYDGPLAGHRVLRLRPEAVIAAQRANTLREVRVSEAEDVVLGVDDLDVLCALDGDRVDDDMLGVVGAMVADPRWRLLLTITERGHKKLEARAPALLAGLDVHVLASLAPEALERIARDHADRLAAYHGVTLPADVRAAALTPRGRGDQRAHPGLLVDRLDRGGARAGLRADKQVRETDLALPSTEPVEAHVDREALQHALLRDVVGQDHVIERVCDRLALTKAQLDLRPERPDGVFLLVGPTGVGKTLTAQSLQRALHGDADIIRLDMSEYAEEWALSRLIGPQPGYVGFTEPESWLTTRVRHRPHTVLLLDEIEKAHPSVWNAFLQVFDAGRLTDARGQEARFDHVVVAMTSNLGADVFARDAIGFGDRAVSLAAKSHAVLEAVKRTMPPELINRLDEILVFHPLSSGAIRDIAARDVAAMAERIAPRGYHVTVDAEVVDLLAEAGYDPAYGARHLARNIERLLLEPLASAHPPGTYRATAEDGAVVWRTP